MDPAARTPARRPSGIPRTRGDGPGGPDAGTTAGTTALRDSPHARGWTSHVDPAPLAQAGFPARAGMDPRRACRGSARSRIPRTRGDGPSPAPTAPSVDADSPHARGWTGGGSPGGRGRRRIPRTRGDGPGPLMTIAIALSDSPHARGWTALHARPAHADSGFPARAGMDPSEQIPKHSTHGIPRTRGDGPDAAAGTFEVRTDSPHARGWTPPRPPLRRRRAGFPARAGMDPTSG